MKCIVEKSLLLVHLQKVCNVAECRGTQPILCNLKLTAEGETLTLTATDLEIRVDTTLRAVVEEAGTTTIPAQKLLDLVTKFKGSEISFYSNENYHTKIKCGLSEFTIYGLNPDDFPEMFNFETEHKIVIKQSDFAGMIDAISYAVATDDSRKVLKGLLFSLKDNFLTAVATDGKRLALIEKQIEDSSGDIEVIIPQKTAFEAKRLLGLEGNITIEFNDRMIRLQTNNTILVSKLIEGTYPNFRQIIPKEFSQEIELQSSDFIPALELVNIPVKGTLCNNVNLTFRKNELELHTKNESFGEGFDKLEIPYDGDEDFSIILNTAYLLSPFKHIGKQNLTFKLNNASSPVALNGEDFLYIIMPIRAA